jgi:ATP-dependent DNA ligase
MERILYTDKNGRTRIIYISVTRNKNGSATITKTTGLLHGTHSVSNVVVKNGYEKALLRAKTMWNNEYTKAHAVLPMLANKWEQRHQYIQTPFYVQPKLDGVRLLVSNDGCFSRTGKPVFGMDELGKHLRNGEYLDGECYDPTISFEKITSLFKTNPQKLEFHVFDYFDVHRPHLPFEERKKYVTVQTILVQDVSELSTYHQRFLNDGYEGIMIRGRDSVYEPGKRSNFLLKMKSFQTEEYEIVGAKEGSGREKGAIIWECIVGDKTFYVKPEGTIVYRRKLWKSWRSYVGEYLTVRYQNLTSFGVPRFPVGIAIRDYE